MGTNAKPVIIYTRVSTVEQADSGLGLEDQEARCRAYCAARGWAVEAVESDPGISAATLGRAGLQRALSRLKGGSVLLALKLDRLTRNVSDLAPLAEQVHKAGADWSTVDEQFDSSTATGRLMLRLVLEISQWEREVIAERTSAALRAKAARGERIGATPYGWRTTGRGTFERNADEWAVIEQARRRCGEASLRQIAAELETLTGRKWHREQVRRLLRPSHLECISSAERTKESDL